ncbi:MAG: DUF1345 domain-containing protein [Acidobacteriaceae bacterium]|nr:DUF1345 domain-containing protein [Acidobacteriaceae bacterium]
MSIESASDDCTGRVPFDLEPNHQSRQLPVEPRWLATVNILALIGLYLALPERLTLGPTWLMPVVTFSLLIPAIISHRRRQIRLNVVLGITLLLVITAAEVWSLSILIAGLPSKRQPPFELLRSAAALWVSNILVFASWYWRLDAGGPHKRYLRASHTAGAFLFPQMTLPPDSKLFRRDWKPDFIDYLFLAFNTSTAFSPTDVPVLSRWAKLLMMIQSAISLGTIAILAARAINIL